MAVSTCVVSGTVLTPTGAGLSGVTIRANAINPIVFSTTNDMVITSEVTTTTDISGAWSLTLVRTMSGNPSTAFATLTITFDYPSGGGSYRRKDYTVAIPDQATVNFADLITGQV